MLLLSTHEMRGCGTPHSSHHPLYISNHANILKYQYHININPISVNWVLPSSKITWKVMAPYTYHDTIHQYPIISISNHTYIHQYQYISKPGTVLIQNHLMGCGALHLSQHYPPISYHTNITSHQYPCSTNIPDNNLI